MTAPSSILRLSLLLLPLLLFLPPSSSVIVVYDGSRTFNFDEELTGFTVAAGATMIGRGAFYDCPKLASLGLMREGVTVIEKFAFFLCPLLTSLQGLPKSLTTIGPGAFESTGLTSLDGLPPAVTAIGMHAFSQCDKLTSIGPGFSPECDVHPKAFARCPALLTAAQAKGFSTAIEWGKHHWLAVNNLLLLPPSESGLRRRSRRLLSLPRAPRRRSGQGLLHHRRVEQAPLARRQRQHHRPLSRSPGLPRRSRSGALSENRAAARRSG